MKCRPAAPARFERFLRFGLVGIVGFIVDVTVLSACIRFLELGPYVARLVSYPAAATATWYLNRRFTFPDARADRRTSQWASFLVVNAVGGAVNYGTYAALVAFTEYAARHPQLAVAAGSLAGLVFNFTGSSLLVFRPR
jgi:putative flippase GtrA